MKFAAALLCLLVGTSPAISNESLRDGWGLKGKYQLPKLIKGVKFQDGIEVIDNNQNAAACSAVTQNRP